MEFKNALAVCLISLFSATLVTLIAQSLDSRAAARLEPQLTRIAEELAAIRASGGTPSSAATASARPLDNGLIVYYFYGNVRCPTCRAIESQSYEALQDGYGGELSAGRIAWKMLNYEEPAVEELVAKFSVINPVVVLAWMEEGRIERWDRLDEVWGLVNDKPAFAAFVRSEIQSMLDQNTDPSAASDPSDIPLPSDAGGEDILIPDESGGAPAADGQE